MLTEPQRQDTSAEIQRDLSKIREPIALTKAELKAAIDATDDWIESNQAAFNTALPAAARANLTANQKVKLFMYVASKRFEVI